jgi:hypothetical protein
MRTALRNNSLTLVMGGLFLVFWAGHSLAGWRQHNEELAEHGRPTIGWADYVRSGDFLESTFENWESEFFQMGAFVLLSAALVQRGAAESKKPPEEGGHEEEDLEPKRDSPAPVHRGGLALSLYSNSLSIALFTLFLITFFLHGMTGLQQHNEQALLHGQAPATFFEYLGSAEFWFQSLQNWQSEFLSVAVLVVLSIFLRQKGSPESKPVHAPHAQTGSSGG